MTPPAISIKQLRALQSAVLSGGQTKAAPKPGVWSAVKALERSLGVKLFKKVAPGRRGLTEHGASVFAHAVKILALVDFLQAYGELNSDAKEAQAA